MITSSFDSMSLSNAFIQLNESQSNNPLFEAAKLNNKLSNLSFKSKSLLFETFKANQVEPKLYFGIENTPDGFEKTIETIRNDYLGYYKGQIDNSTPLNLYLKSKLNSFVFKLLENSSLLERFLRIRRFSEIVFVTLKKSFMESNNYDLINLKEKENSKNRSEFLKFCVNELVENDVKKTTSSISRRFGDSNYK